MATIYELIALLVPFFLADECSSNHQKPVTHVEWQGRCIQNSMAINDCNWCRCNDKHRYMCDARICNFVDQFGHFNDAIRDIEVGMEGKGSWRSSQLPCEPGVQYRRSGLLCVCNGDGTWPNPVCRDIFRVLHSVELTGDQEVTGQTCIPSKLYLVGCNVCYCTSRGQLDRNLCTKQQCPEDDPVMKVESEEEVTEAPSFKDEEIYAECDINYRYKIGCKTCNCLRNNRLHCDNCTFTQQESIKSFCSNLEPGQTFNIGCNLCYCDEKNFAYCSTKKCTLRQTMMAPLDLLKTMIESKQNFDGENCVPGNSYRQGCNTCYCDLRSGKKVFACTLKQCARSGTSREMIHLDCVAGTTYELDCLVCQCDEVGGVRTQLCWVNKECTGREAVRETRTPYLDSLHGYCEPLHVYKQGCNTCHCLSDGKTVRCTSYVCGNRPSVVGPGPDPVSVELVPVAQDGDACPAGYSYKIQCNYCFCLPNGNALCTTHDCTDKKKNGAALQ